MTAENVQKKELSLPFILVRQPIGTFYIASVGAGQLLDYVDVLRRGMTEEEQRNVQRKLNLRRQRDIAAYVTDPDATFPTSVIISVYEDAVTIDEGRGLLNFEFPEKLGEVLDGQHRLEGLRLAREAGHIDTVRDFQLPVVFMIDLDPDDKAYVFSIINSKQTQVSSSLIFDLFGLQTARSPQKLCHEIAQTLNGKKDNPFYQGLKMLGNRHFASEMLTQGAFAKYVLTLISKTPEEDARREKRKEKLVADDSLPLRKFYIDRKDEVVGKIIENYFRAIADTFPEEWSRNPKTYVLRKTVGFSALIKIFHRLWSSEIAPNKDATSQTFRKIAERLKVGIGQTPLTSAHFSSNEAGADRLAAALLKDFQA